MNAICQSTVIMVVFCYLAISFRSIDAQYYCVDNGAECVASLSCSEAVERFFGSICRGGGSPSIIASSLTPVRHDDVYGYDQACVKEATCLLVQEGRRERACVVEALYQRINDPYFPQADLVVDVICCVAATDPTMACDILVDLIERQSLLLPELTDLKDIDLLSRYTVAQAVAPMIVVWKKLLNHYDDSICLGVLCPSYVTLVTSCVHPVMLASLLMVPRGIGAYDVRLLDQLCSCLLPRMFACPAFGRDGIVAWLVAVATVLASNLVDIVTETGESKDQELIRFLCPLCQCKTSPSAFDAQTMLAAFMSQLDDARLQSVIQAIVMCDQ